MRAHAARTVSAAAAARRGVQLQQAQRRRNRDSALLRVAARRTPRRRRAARRSRAAAPPSCTQPSAAHGAAAVQVGCETKRPCHAVVPFSSHAAFCVGAPAGATASRCGVLPAQHSRQLSEARAQALCAPQRAAPAPPRLSTSRRSKCAFAVQARTAPQPIVLRTASHSRVRRRTPTSRCARVRAHRRSGSVVALHTPRKRGGERSRPRLPRLSEAPRPHARVALDVCAAAALTAAPRVSRVALPAPTLFSRPRRGACAHAGAGSASRRQPRALQRGRHPSHFTDSDNARSWRRGKGKRDGALLLVALTWRSIDQSAATTFHALR
jgi:hypothetical protein